MNKNYKKHIITDPKVRFGKPIIKNTRVPVELVVTKVATGTPIAKIAKEYELTETQIFAALQYAADLVSSEHEWSYK